MELLPQRKNIRLKSYDYSSGGAYFVTFCVENMRELLGEVVGGGFHAAPLSGAFDLPAIVKLSNIGEEIVKTIEYINQKYEGVEINKYVVMPNHVHLIIFLTGGHGNPPLQDVVGRLKSYTTKKWNDICKTKMQEIWQRNYFEHILRNEKDYLSHWQYIDGNPARWEEDECCMGNII